MPFTKGQSGNPSGRPAGSKNKAQGEIRERIKAFLEGNFDQIEENWHKLKPVEQIIVYERLLKYAIPPLQSLSVKEEFDI